MNLKALRDQIVGYASDASTADADALKTRLSEIAANIETVVRCRPLPTARPYRAANLIDGTQEAYARAAEALTIGLSAAH